ncbi:hypothetical protein J5H83_00475 [Pseudomonas otitidis]|nr:hypothetical protein [Pseudomonas otitidis]
MINALFPRRTPTITTDSPRGDPLLPVPGARYRLQEKAPVVVGVALVAAMSLSLAWQTADWIRLLRAPAPTSSDSPQAAAVPPSLDRLDRLFGPARIQQEGPPPATNLRLVLLGSFINADPARSSAIIRADDNKPRRILAGESISDGVRLHAVYRDRVEIERGGRLETLTFPHTRPSATVSPVMDAAPADGAIEALEGLQDENAAELRERMEALRKQMEESGGLPPDSPPEQPMESE